MSDEKWTDVDHVRDDLYELQVEVSQLKEYIEVLEGDLEDMKLVFRSPWWSGGVL